jgi:hypothetical protein
MIPGSKLVCINPNHETLEFLKSIGNKIPNGTPQIYTLRNLEKVEGIWSLRLVEITNPEMFLPIYRFSRMLLLIKIV